MYLHHELREVNQYRQTEALARIDLLHGLMQQSGGFLRSLACRYLGNTSQYMWLRMWDTHADHLAFRGTPAAADFGATRPDGLYWQLPGAVAPGGHWLSILENGRPGLGDTVLRFAFAVPEDATDDFLADRKLHADLTLRSPGITSLVTFESEEQEAAGRQYITLVRTESIQAYRQFLESPLGESYRSRVPEGRFEPLTTECYEIVRERAREDKR